MSTPMSTPTSTRFSADTDRDSLLMKAFERISSAGGGASGLPQASYYLQRIDYENGELDHVIFLFPRPGRLPLQSLGIGQERRGAFLELVGADGVREYVGSDDKPLDQEFVDSIEHDPAGLIICFVARETDTFAIDGSVRLGGFEAHPAAKMRECQGG